MPIRSHDTMMSDCDKLTIPIQSKEQSQSSAILQPKTHQACPQEHTGPILGLQSMDMAWDDAEEHLVNPKR
jgi:hypothetical protein